MRSPIEISDKVWASISEREWKRVKWRQVTEEAEPQRCCIFGTPIHREGTYYLRPAYTDGQRWMCAQAYQEWQRHLGKKPNNRYSKDRKTDRD